MTTMDATSIHALPFCREGSLLAFLSESSVAIFQYCQDQDRCYVHFSAVDASNKIIEHLSLTTGCRRAVRGELWVMCMLTC